MKKHKSTYRYGSPRLEQNDFVLRTSFLSFFVNVCSELGARQRETGSNGQASHASQGERQPRTHLLSDGPNVGHPC